mmetsp:Transcript_69217/g.84869  ORF Transcript_69217/g.84869 Transcript_69217/m.84869 type:complete len:201 (+) Transcript_69217:32-634(+)
MSKKGFQYISKYYRHSWHNNPEKVHEINYKYIRIFHDKFVFFYNGPFSQFWPSNFIIDNIEYQWAEQYQQSQKALLMKDDEGYNKIMNAVHPMDCKLYGKQIKNFDKNIWFKNRYDVVYQGNYAKFTQNIELKQELIKYRDHEFAECDPNDKIWGIGLNLKDLHGNTKRHWNGDNLLGLILTELKNNLILEIDQANIATN